MVYAILAAIACLMGGGVFFWYKISGAGASKERAEALKAGSQAGERQDEEFEKVRGNLAERIAGKLRDHPNRKT
jgi:hypothetical protein